MEDFFTIQFENVGIFNQGLRSRPMLRVLNQRIEKDGCTIIGINESGFKKNHPPTGVCETFFPKFTLHRLDRDDGTGHGLLLFVLDRVFDSRVLESNAELEQLWIELMPKIDEPKKIVLCLAYMSPNITTRDAVNRLENVAKKCDEFKIEEEKKMFLFLGDLNLKINYKNGKLQYPDNGFERQFNVLQNVMDKFNLVQANSFRHGQRKTTIDICLHNSPVGNVKCKSIVQSFKADKSVVTIGNNHMNLVYTVGLNAGEIFHFFFTKK